jgi:hypothetical protein
VGQKADFAGKTKTEKKKTDSEVKTLFSEASPS